MVAYELDNAVTLRLLKYDNEKDAANKRFWAKLVTGEDIGASEHDPLIANDPYADANTILS